MTKDHSGLRVCMWTRCDWYYRRHEIRETDCKLECVDAAKRAPYGCDHMVDTKVLLHKLELGIHPIPRGNPREPHLQAAVCRTRGQILPQPRIGQEVSRDDEIFRRVKCLAGADEKFIVVVVPSKVLKRKPGVVACGIELSVRHI